MRRLLNSVVPVVLGLWLAACAGLPEVDPVQVTVAGIEALPGEGLEARMLVKLRVQNPNDAPIDFDGAYVRLQVQEKTFATGVSDARGTVPRFGEAIVEVPVTISMLNVARQVLGALGRPAEPLEKITYSLDGKLHGTGFRTVRFTSKGELQLPATLPAPQDSATP